MPSICCLYYDDQDIKMMRSMVAKERSTAESKQLKKRNIDEVRSYCTNYDECRRVNVLRYFGEVFDAKNCSANKHAVCDNCEKMTTENMSKELRRMQNESGLFDDLDEFDDFDEAIDFDALEQDDRPSTSSGARGGQWRFKRRFKKASNFKSNFKNAKKRSW